MLYSVVVVVFVRDWGLGEVDGLFVEFVDECFDLSVCEFLVVVQVEVFVWVELIDGVAEEDVG